MRVDVIKAKVEESIFSHTLKIFVVSKEERHLCIEISEHLLPHLREELDLEQSVIVKAATRWPHLHIP